MKKYYIIFSILLSFNNIFAHKEWVHQHIVKEAYLLLANYYNIPVPTIETNLGSYGPGDGKWIHGEILKGAYREDLEDVITGVGAVNQAWDPSSTHFWDVDNNDFGNTPVTTIWTVPVMNAYKKAYLFINGGWRLTYLNNVYVYNSLIDLYKNGNLHLVGSYNIQGKLFSRDEWIIANTELRRILVWEILGRVCHLLADMSVPAHVHIDTHPCAFGDQDNYEIEIASAGHGILNCNEQTSSPGAFMSYNAVTAFNSGDFINPYNYDANNPIRYLFYLMAQITDHFASNDAAGDNNLYNSSYPGISALISTLGPAHSAGNVTTSQNALVLMNLVIRVTASLLYWFAIEADLNKSITISTNFTNLIVNVRNPARSISQNSQYISKIPPYTIPFNNNITIDLMADLPGNYNFLKWDKRNKNNTVVSFNSAPEWLNANANATSFFVSMYTPIITLSFNPIVTDGQSSSMYYQNLSTGEISTQFQFPANFPATIKAVAPVNYNFISWSDGHIENPRSFNIPSNISGLYAIFKQIRYSNAQGGLLNNNQRKFVRSINGVLHLVYHSLGHVWYERSSDNGVTWSLANNGEPLDRYGAKDPSIDLAFSDYTDDGVIIIFQENTGLEEGEIINAQYYANGALLYGTSIIDYDFNAIASPVLSMLGPRVIVIWKDFDGLYFRLGQPVTSENRFIWYNSSTKITGTTANSNQPSVAATYEAEPDNVTRFHLAWNENNTAIKYVKITRNTNETLTFSSPETISTSSGYPVYSNPSIAVAKGYPAVGWYGTPYSGSSSGAALYKVRGASSWGTLFSRSGNYIASPNVNSIEDQNGLTNDRNYAFVWSERNASNQTIDKIYRNGSVYDIKTPANVIMSGRYLQAANGTTFNSTYVSAFTNASTPYFFTASKSVGSLSKENIENNFFVDGRTAVFSKNNAEVYFTVKNVKVDSTIVNFEPITDTLIVKKDDFNNYLVSQPFAVAKSNISFDTEVWSIDSTLTQKEFSEGSIGSDSKFKFVIELIDAEKLTAANNITEKILSGNNLFSDNKLAFKINAAGISGKQYRLRMRIDQNDPDVSVALIINHISDAVLAEETGLRKDIKEIEFVSRYDLMQNYPNPFNPSTIINYQLPKAGHVTLKIYDMLGKEVATLADEYKVEGKYSVEFDGSKLSSGVYFYELKVNSTTSESDDYSSIKKMLLLK